MTPRAEQLPNSPLGHDIGLRPHRGLRLALGRLRTLHLLPIALLAAASVQPSAAGASEDDAVRVWNERAVLTLTNGPAAAIPGTQFSPPVTFIHLAIVQGAVYDALNAIKGGHDPYLPGLKAATSASKGAAAAAAAYTVLTALVDQVPVTATLTPAVKTAIRQRLSDQYAASLGEIPDGQAKAKGIEVGVAAATAMLANRQDDGRFGAPGFPVPATPEPGQWRPLAGNDPNAWVRLVRPFALPKSEYFHTPGPLPLSSAQYAADFNEVKALGRATGSTRSDAQTQLAVWTTGHPAPMIYSAMRQIAASRNLAPAAEARLYAMTSVSGADSVINCFAEKAHWSFWRPTTAIRLAASDGNDATSADPDWTSLLTVPPYPDEPSGANCLFSGVMHSAKAFFGSDAAEFDLQGAGSTRHYTSFTAVVGDVIEARLYGGLHFRRADLNGARLGQQVADYVDRNYFNCGPRGQCKQEDRE